MIPLCARDLLEPLQGPLGVPGSYCYKLCMSGKMLENRLRFFLIVLKCFCLITYWTCWTECTWIHLVSWFILVKNWCQFDFRNIWHMAPMSFSLYGQFLSVGNHMFEIICCLACELPFDCLLLVAMLSPCSQSRILWWVQYHLHGNNGQNCK